MEKTDFVQKGLRAFKGSLLREGRAFWPTLYLAALALYAYQPWNHHPVTAFDRVMGEATAADVLVSGRTGAALAALVVLLPLALLVSWWLVSLCLSEKAGAPGTADGPRLGGVISVFSGLGLCLQALQYGRRFGSEKEIWLTEAQAIPITLVVCLLLWCAFRRALPAARRTVSGQGVYGALLTALPLTLTLDLCAGWQLYTAAQYGAVCLAVLAAAMLVSLFWPGAADHAALWRAAGLPLALCLPLALAYLEITQLLTQYGVDGAARRGPVTGLLALCVAAALLAAGLTLYWEHHTLSADRPQPAGTDAAAMPARAQKTPGRRLAAKRHTLSATRPQTDWKRVWYPLLLVSMALLAAQPELQSCVATDLFERANGAVSISGFLRFGQLPAIETHGAHMVSDYLGGIFWGLVNRDALSACFTSYSGIPLALTTLVFYALLRLCIGPDAAFAAALLAPVTNIAPGDWYAHLSYLPALALVWLVQKRSFGRYAALWGAAAFAVLYRGDIGLAVGLAALLLAFIDAAVTAYTQKSGRCWRQLLTAGLAVGGPLAGLAAALCALRGIDPLARLREFLQLMAFSNQNWAYEGIGEPGTAGMVWTFLVTPVLLVGLTLWQLHVLRAAKQPLTAAHWLFFLFTAAYFLNYTRTLVRHSLKESIPVYCLAMGMWALALGVWLAWRGVPAKKNGHVALPLLLTAAILTSGALFDARLAAGESLADRAFSRFAEGEIVDYQLAEADGSTRRVKTVRAPVRRVVLPQWIDDITQPLAAELDGLLGPEDTWLDFTNQSTLYALLGRRSPVYVNQSPGLLCGEYTQKAFIAEIEAMGDRVPVALLPRQNMMLSFVLDGVQNSLRYYRVAEYIYTHYTPWRTVAGFSVWLRNDLAEAARQPSEDAPVADYGRLRGINATLRRQDDALEVTGGDDPQLEGVEKLIDTGAIRDGQLTLTLTYTTDKDGAVQLFYAGTGRNFSEADSVRAPVKKTDQPATVRLTVPCTPNSRLRLDTPDNAVFTLRGVEPLQTGATSCGYDYASFEDAHLYNMGHIARLWGEADTARAAENPVLPGLTALSGGSYDIASAACGGENGRYVRLRVTAGAETTASVSLCRRGGSAGTVRLASFRFTVSPGTHTYLVRVSADSFWYSGEVNTLTVYADDPEAKVEAVELLDGD